MTGSALPRSYFCGNVLGKPRPWGTWGIRDTIDMEPGSLSRTTTPLLKTSGEEIFAVVQLWCPSGDAHGGIEIGRERELRVRQLTTALLLSFFTRAAL